MIHAATPERMKRALEARGHTVTVNDNDTYMRARHGAMPLHVSFFKPAHNQPWRIVDRARILRALKLFAFFCLVAALIFHQQLAGAWHQLTAFAASHIL